MNTPTPQEAVSGAEKPEVAVTFDVTNTTYVKGAVDPRAREFIAKLDAMGVLTGVVTNGSQTEEEIVKAFAKDGMSMDFAISGGMLAGDLTETLAKNNGAQSKKVHVMGNDFMRKYLQGKQVQYSEGAIDMNAMPDIVTLNMYPEMTKQDVAALADLIAAKEDLTIVIPAEDERRRQPATVEEMKDVHMMEVLKELDVLLKDRRPDWKEKMLKIGGKPAPIAFETAQNRSQARVLFHVGDDPPFDGGVLEVGGVYVWINRTGKPYEGIVPDNVIVIDSFTDTHPLEVIQRIQAGTGAIHNRIDTMISRA